eukprot:2658159-Rhodomonas_salina.3
MLLRPSELAACQSRTTGRLLQRWLRTVVPGGDAGTEKTLEIKIGDATAEPLAQATERGCRSVSHAHFTVARGCP